MYPVSNPHLARPLSAVLGILILAFGMNGATAGSVGVKWTASLPLIPTAARTEVGAMLANSQITTRMQSLGVTARLSTDQVQLSGTRDLAQLRNAIFDQAGDFADLLNGPATVTLTLPAGRQPVRIELESRPATGYVWQVLSSGAGYTQSGPSSVDMRESAPGAAAVQTIELRPRGNGGGTVQLVYQRPFESNAPIKSRVTLAVTGTTNLIELTNPDPALPSAEPQVGDTATALAALPPRVSLPTSYDARTLNIVPAVRNQGGCGSCWAFGTVGIMEIATKLGGGPLADLSEQFLVSCNNNGYSCSGGWFANPYHYNTLGIAQTAIGAVNESEKPYTATNGSCSTAYSHPYKAKATQYVVSSGTIPTNDQIKNAIMTYGAVAVAVCADNGWGSYKGGVYSPTYNACGGINHAVVLIGWDDSTQSWLLRNSWGTSWGESGYMRIKYDPTGANSWVGYGANWISYSGGTTQYSLTVSASGASGVAIGASPSTYAGTTNYTKTGIASGTGITLTAPATAGTKSFSNWSGCTSTSGTSCTVSMTSDKAVTANYVTPSTYTLTVNSSGASSVTVPASPSTYAGTTNYSKTGIASGTSVTLTAPATAGTASFSSWSGCTTTSGTTCTLTMTANKTVTATYATPSTVSLTVNASGASGVAVTASPTTHAGTTNYTKTGIKSGTAITLTAPATSGAAAFSGWSGCTSTSGATCSLTMTANTTVTANYVTQSTYSLTVNTAGASALAIGAVPATYAGTSNYTKTGIAKGTVITLKAPTNSGSFTFSGWTGCNSTAGTACDLVMDSSKAVTATYTTTGPDLLVTGVVVSPSSPTVGSAFTATVTVRNQGTAAVDTGWVDVWTHQPNSQGCESEGALNKPLGTIAAGATQTYTFEGLVARSAGNKTFRAFVDTYCQVGEADKTNNQYTLAYTAVPGGLGFNEQFNSGNAENWTRHSGAWAVQSGLYHTAGVASLRSMTSYNVQYTDVDYTARIIRFDSVDGSASAVHIRASGPVDADGTTQNVYLFQIVRAGYFSVWKRVNGVSTPIWTWAYSSAIAQGSSGNTLRVIAKGSSMMFYINGTLVWQGSDTSLTSGTVGVSMYNAGTTGNDFQVDWATLTPNPAALPKAAVAPSAVGQAVAVAADVNGVGY